MQVQLSGLTAFARRPSFQAIAGLGTTQVIGWGTSFSAMPIFGTPIAADLGLAREWVFGGITVMLLVSALVAPRVGRLVDRMGARHIMVVGSLIATVGMLVQSIAFDLISYMAGWIVVGIATPMMLGNAAMPGLVQVVGPNARAAITSLMLISGLTSTVFLPLNAYLLGAVGWRQAYIVFALMHLLICAPLHWLALRPRQPDASPGTATTAAAAKLPPPDGLLDPAHRRQAFVLMAIWFCTEGLITWGLYLQIIDVMIASGLTMTQAITVWAIVGPCQSLARLGELISGGKHSILTTTLLASLAVSVSFLALLPIGITLYTAIAFCICMGIGHGLFAVARNTLPLILFGSREFGTYIGLLTVPQNIVNAAAPIVFAAVISRLSPAWALWISAISAWIGLVSVLVLVRFCRKAMKEKGIVL